MKPHELVDRVGPHATADVVKPLLDHPDTDESHLLRLLRKRELSSSVIEALARHDRWGRRHVVRTAVVNHPKTPRTLALRLLSLLFWKEQLRVARNMRLAMPLRMAAENRLKERLPELEVGERISLARTVPPVSRGRVGERARAPIDPGAPPESTSQGSGRRRHRRPGFNPRGGAACRRPERALGQSATRKIGTPSPSEYTGPRRLVVARAHFASRSEETGCRARAAANRRSAREADTRWRAISLRARRLTPALTGGSGSDTIGLSGA